MIFSLLYVPIVVLVYHYYGVEIAGLTLSGVAFITLLVAWKKEADRSSIVAPIIAFLLGISAFFIGNFTLLKLYPLLLSILFLGYFIFSVTQGDYPLIKWIERFKKRPLLSWEIKDIIASHIFWIWVLLLNTSIHFFLLLKASIKVWAIYSFAGWYVLFGIAIALQISYVHRRSIYQLGRNSWGYGLFVGVILIGFLPAITGYLFHRLMGVPKPHIIFQRVVAMMFRLFFRYSPGTSRIRFIPNENLQLGSPYIYVSSHESWLDYPLMGGYLIDLYHLTNKKKAFVWYLRPIARLLGVVDGVGHSALYILLQKLRVGSNVLIFPEGSRSVDDKIAPFKRGAFSLSIESGIEVVPVLISGTRELVAKGSLNWNDQKGIIIEVEILDPVKGNPGEKSEDFAKRVRELMHHHRKNRNG